MEPPGDVGAMMTTSPTMAMGITMPATDSMLCAGPASVVSYLECTVLLISMLQICCFRGSSFAIARAFMAVKKKVLACVQCSQLGACF